MPRTFARAFAAVLIAAAVGCTNSTPADQAVAPAESVPAAAPLVTPPPAQDVVGDAVERARAANQIVLIEFGASWCTWCRHFESFVQSAAAGPIIQDNYLIVNLIVHEEESLKALEHPGGLALMEEWGGANSGLPFYVFLDGTGTKIADSNAMPDGTNIGFPVSDTEIEQFMGLLDRTAPRVTADERATILAELQNAGSAS